MATYAIGDVQGCYERLLALLSYISFNPQQDTLWFCGDLINRGPSSLETLRFIKKLGPSAKSVLGNHDLHLLAIHHGTIEMQKVDTLGDILKAPDRKDLMDWLLQQPLLVEDTKTNHVMTHAGIHPRWGLTQAKQLAKELSHFIQAEPLYYFQNMYGSKPDNWDERLTGLDRYRFITNAFTRMRYCYPNGRLDLSEKLAPPAITPNLIPWYTLRAQQQADNTTLIFGHWASLMGEVDEVGFVAIDTGCGWGGKLTAYCLETGELFQVPGLKN